MSIIQDERVSGRRWVNWLAAMLPVVLLGVAGYFATGGHFTYSLDDPYIHLALARNIWNGWYGINPGEVTAPSSSILWPLLLAPFAAVPAVFEYVPLVFNVLAVGATAWIMLRLLEPWAGQRPAVAAIVILAALNLYGLVFSGMEHSLQILLTVIIAEGVISPERIAPGRRWRFVFFASLVLLPLIRYEGLAVSVPVIVHLFSLGERRAPAVALVAIGVVLGGFSLFLLAHGLGVLPSSVLLKSGMGNSPLLQVIATLRANLEAYGLVLVIVMVIYIYGRSQNLAYAVLPLVVTVLHFAFGHYGWFGRYEVYQLAFVLVIGLGVLRQAGWSVWAVAAVLPFALMDLFDVNTNTPAGMANIYGQQARMAEIARRLDGPVAINDLGLVALRSGKYVLDLWGLGSKEVLDLRRRAADPKQWMSDLMDRHGVHYVMIYDKWFPTHPDSWIKVASLKLKDPAVSAGSDEVSLYASDAGAAGRMRAVVQAYEQEAASPYSTITLTAP